MNTTKTITAGLILLSLVLTGCTAQQSSEEAEANAQLNSFAQAVLEVNEQKFYELFCPEVNVDQLWGLFKEADQDAHKRFKEMIENTVIDTERSKEGEFWYLAPSSNSSTGKSYWVVKKIKEKWCIDIYDENTVNLNDDGGELQQRMKEAREKYLEKMEGE